MYRKRKKKHNLISTNDVNSIVSGKNDKNFENKKEVYLNEQESIANKHTDIDSKSTTNNSDRLPKTGTVRAVLTPFIAGILFIVASLLGLKKKDQD